MEELAGTKGGQIGKSVASWMGELAGTSGE
jgi:hypothetical protein